MHKTGYNEDEVLNTSCGSNAKLLQEEREVVLVIDDKNR